MQPTNPVSKLTQLIPPAARTAVPIARVSPTQLPKQVVAMQNAQKMLDATRLAPSAIRNVAMPTPMVNAASIPGITSGPAAISATHAVANALQKQSAMPNSSAYTYPTTNQLTPARGNSYYTPTAVPGGNPSSSDDSMGFPSTSTSPSTPPEFQTFDNGGMWSPPETLVGISDAKNSTLTSITTSKGSNPTSTALAIPTTTPSLWTRIINWFKSLFSKKKDDAQPQMAGEKPSSMTVECASLVRRARNGDQNAMAMLACIRDNAKKGVTTALVSQKLIMNYIQGHPDGDYATMHGESSGAVGSMRRALGSATKLSFGPILSNASIRDFSQAANLHGDELEAFTLGVNGVPVQDFRLAKANRLGVIIGHAKRLQAMRMPHVPFSEVDPVISWELDG